MVVQVQVKEEVMLTFEEFISRWREYRKSQPYQRCGQALFNVLTDYRPDLAERLRGGANDPFYDDTLVPAALTFLYNEWEVVGVTVGD